MFCSRCGKELIMNNEDNNYDTETGELVHSIKLVNLACPTGLCGHTNIHHNYQSHFLGFFAKCTKCGIPEPCWD